MGSCCHGPWLWCNRLSREEPTCPVLGLLGTDHAVPGPACGRKSLESASLPGRERWEAPLPPAPPTTSSWGPCSGWLSCSLPPCSSLSAGPHTAGQAGWLPFRGESSCLGSLGWDWAGFRAKRHGGALVLIVALIVLGGLTARTSWALCLGCSHAGLTIRHRPRVSLRWDRLVLLLQRPRPGASTVSTGQPSWLLRDPSPQRTS